MRFSIPLLAAILIGCKTPPVPVVQVPAPKVAPTNKPPSPPGLAESMAVLGQSQTVVVPPPVMISQAVMTMPAYMTLCQGTYFLQYSTDAVNWNLLATNSLGTSLVVTDGTPDVMRFYRTGFGTLTNATSQ